MSNEPAAFRASKGIQISPSPTPPTKAEGSIVLYRSSVDNALHVVSETGVDTALGGSGTSIPSGTDRQVLAYVGTTPTAVPATTLLATDSVAGFMSSADKAVHDGYFGAHVWANTQAGSDIGAKILAAAAALNGAKGMVHVGDGDYAQTTKVIVPSNVTVKLGRGTYSNSFAESTQPHFLLKNGGSLIGAGWSTIVQNPIVSTIRATAVGDHDTYLGDGAGGGGISGVGNNDLLVRDIQFVPNPASTSSGQGGAVQFGNVTNATVDHCYFNGTEGYGAFQASDSSTGNYARNLKIINSTFENIENQNCGVINGEDWWICGNTFRLITSGGPTLIDCEQNIATDHGRNFHITGNTFDFGTSPIANQPGSLIQVLGGGGTQGSLVGRACYGKITDNVCIGGLPGTHDYFVAGITVSGADQVDVSDNIIASCYGYGVALIGSNSCSANDNRKVSCGATSSSGGGAAAVLVRNTTNSTINDNVIVDPYATPRSTPRIQEDGTSDYNTYSGNRFHYTGANTGNDAAGYNMRVDIVGAHSRVYDSTYGTTSTDPRLVDSIATLRLLPVPGARPTAAPAMAILGGHTAQGDSGQTLWKFDPASTRADNGFTVVQPTYPTVAGIGGTAGRWVLCADRIALTTTARLALALTSADASFKVFDTTLEREVMWDGTAWQVSMTTTSIYEPLYFDAADAAQALGATNSAASFTLAATIVVLKPATLKGIKFFWVGGSFTIRCKLWQAGNATALASVDVPISSAGTYNGLFSTPQSLTPGATYYISFWDTAGANTVQIPSSASTPGGTTAVIAGGREMMLGPYIYTTGDALPNTTLTASVCFPVAPLYTVP